MKRYTVIAIFCGAALILCIASVWFVHRSNTPDVNNEDIYQQSTILDNNTAEPGLGGFYQIEWECRGESQLVSFHILTQGEGYLDVTIEEIDPSTQPYTVKRVLSERVPVTDQNRDVVESRTFSSLIPAGQAVHIGLSGSGGAETSQNHTFTAQTC